jgi:hypothetical protein
MSGLAIQPDSSDEVIAAGLDPEEIDQLREWFCYTKTIGRSIKIVATPARAGSPSLYVLAAGTEPSPREQVCG